MHSLYSGKLTSSSNTLSLAASVQTMEAQTPATSIASDTVIVINDMECRETRYTRDVVEALADCLEADLLCVQEKYVQAVQEANRLREHLITLDAELTEEGHKRDQLVERFKERIHELQGETAYWRKLYEGQSVSDDDEEDDELVQRMASVTKELAMAQEECETERRRSRELMNVIREKDREMEQVTVALRHLESGMKREIEVGVAECRSQLVQAHQTIERMRVELEDVRAEAQAVPDLKRKIAELDVRLERLHLDTSSNERDIIDKALMGNLLVNLFDQSRPVDRRQVALMMCSLLGVSADDQSRMGLSSEHESGLSSSETGK